MARDNVEKLYLRVWEHWDTKHLGMNMKIKHNRLLFFPLPVKLCFVLVPDKDPTPTHTNTLILLFNFTSFQDFLYFRKSVYSQTTVKVKCKSLDLFCFTIWSPSCKERLSANPNTLNMFSIAFVNNELYMYMTVELCKILHIFMSVQSFELIDLVMRMKCHWLFGYF